ncbi:hypothetical protein LCGC14_0952880 [marine sediment metagenome]|uniref:Exonuclease domain-containing protein n=1 Tax=marine sediment metagenome TaxID=412755 RepID=A0A0F9P2T7_9ZZZZ
MPNSIKMAFIDLETTGLFPNQHAVIQIACLIFIDWKFATSFKLNIRPFPEDTIDDRALKVNGVTREELKTFTEPKKALSIIKSHLSDIQVMDKTDKYLFYAYNAPFDSDFLRAFFKKCGDRYFGSYFFAPAIDVMSLAADFMKYERSSMINFKQVTVAKQLGVPAEEALAHDPMYDVLMTYRIYHKTICKEPALPESFTKSIEGALE